MRTSCSAGLGSLVLAAMLALPARAETVEDFYKGRTITLVTGYSVGGGFDLYHLLRRVRRVRTRVHSPA